MLFSSIIFIFFFLPLTLGLYYIIPSRYLRARNAVLLAASLIFYSWGEPVYVLLMIYSAFLNYFCALQVKSEQRKGGTGKKNLTFAVVMNLFILGFFKYFGFLMDTINSVTGAHIKYTALALPIGISFYTFQAMSYVIDVYRNDVPPQKNFFRFALYLSLFPQLIAGPIVRYRDVAEELENRSHSLEDFGRGAMRFVFGLGKKVILANNLGALYASVTALPDSKVTVLTYWIGIIAYTFQIYFDFSGYSDMAIGLGRMMGFHFLENFNYPYIATSITDFWRRWHMSLSSWFREYVYIPLGGNRVPVHRHILNLLIVWSLTGMWHGANWNFIMWGTYFGILLILEKYIYGKKISRLPLWAQHTYTMLIVIVSWVFFSITDIGQAFHYLKTMFFMAGKPLADVETLYLLRTSFVLLAASAICSTPAAKERFRKIAGTAQWPGLALMTGIFVLSVSYLVFGSYNPFLYFRF